MMEEMLIYYNITRDRYINNVIIQVVGRHLLDDLDKEFRIDWFRRPEIFNRVTRDPHLEGRRRECDKVKNREPLGVLCDFGELGGLDFFTDGFDGTS
ncbi:uncharacterized protein K441DRAFT_658608 [Cenococcum geophilum 1.58]|uniref:uncharacterized protein n=1 Tax=Cenococcum geophilum 1.58 TaxID=794803 RepID=UPI00358FA862|nr:hypothetical protein K441DRAFT_658608 [Cenococcum geophilum 1.58]